MILYGVLKNEEFNSADERCILTLSLFTLPCSPSRFFLPVVYNVTVLTGMKELVAVNDGTRKNLHEPVG